jgi:hypothetical protein
MSWQKYKKIPTFIQSALKQWPERKKDIMAAHRFCADYGLLWDLDKNNKPHMYIHCDAVYMGISGKDIFLSMRFQNDIIRSIYGWYLKDHSKANFHHVTLTDQALDDVLRLVVFYGRYDVPSRTFLKRRSRLKAIHKSAVSSCKSRLNYTSFQNYVWTILERFDESN